MKNYWLVLSQDTFLWTKGEEGLLYSTSGEHMLFRFRNVGIIAHVVENLLQVENLYRTQINEIDLANPELQKWVETIMSSGSAKLIEAGENGELLVSLKPVLKIQDDLAYYQVTHERHIDGHIMQNLLKLIIHLNGSQFGNDNIAQQITFPMKKSEVRQDPFLLKDFMTSMGTPNFLTEVILTGCIWEYKNYESIVDFTLKLSLPVSIYCTEEDFVAYKSKVSDDKNISYYILKSDYTSIHPIQKTDNLFYHFIVSSDSDYQKAFEAVKNYDLTNFRILPVYTGDNLDFFKEHIYLSEDDIQDISISKREVFARQAININHFGVLNIDVDGNVYASFNEKALGTINNSLYTIVYRELTTGNSWLRVRNQKPCSDCIYQYICPSPSNYEQKIGKANLCHIQP